MKYKEEELRQEIGEVLGEWLDLVRLDGSTDCITYNSLIYPKLKYSLVTDYGLVVLNAELTINENKWNYTKMIAINAFTEYSINKRFDFLVSEIVNFFYEQYTESRLISDDEKIVLQGIDSGSISEKNWRGL